MKLNKNGKNITLVINPTRFMDWDILAIGDITLLRQLSHKNKWFHLIEKSKYGGIPILVMDTADNLKNAINCIKEYKELYNL